MQEIKHISKEIEKYISSCFSNVNEQYQHLSGAGATYLFEEKLKKHYNKKYAVTFPNATSALQTLCIALDLSNTEIITSPINWGGSISPFLLHMNKLRFTSFDPISLNLSSKDLLLSITPKSKAVLSVDFNGNLVDSEAIKKICSENNLLYISDSSQSLGAFFNNKPAGCFADATVLSFTAGKSVFGGEGGCVLTDIDDIYERLLFFSQHPSRQKAVFGLSNYNEYSPLNGRINPLSAILLNETFEDSLWALKEYQSKCFQLLWQLQDNNLVEDTPHILYPSASTFFGFSLRLKESSGLKQVNEFLKDHQLPFDTREFVPRLIPYDSSFRNQFRRKFSCTNALIEQNKIWPPKSWFKLIYSP